jgi:hypothetical protein
MMKIKIECLVENFHGDAANLNITHMILTRTLTNASSCTYKTLLTSV